MGSALTHNMSFQSLQPNEQHDCCNVKHDFDTIDSKFNSIRPRQHSIYQTASSETNHLQFKGWEPKISSNQPKINTKITPLKNVQRTGNFKQFKRVAKHQPKISDDLHLPSIFKNKEAAYSTDK